MNVLNQYIDRAKEIVGERTPDEEKYDREVIRWLRRRKCISKAIAKANQKYPKEALQVNDDKGEQRSLRALPYDRSRRRVETDLRFAWEIIEGGGALEHRHDQVAMFIAAAEPGLARVKVMVSQNDIERSAEALITVTCELLSQTGTTMVESQGLPGYTFESAPGDS